MCTRCGKRPALDGSELCQKHLKDKRKRDSSYRERQREKRKAANLCIWCPQSRPPVKLPEGQATCIACRISHRRFSSTVEVVGNDVDRAARIAARTKTHADGRTRYHGQPRRGQPPRDQLDAQDLRMAKGCMEAFELGLAELQTEAVKAAPRVQRDSAHSTVLHEGERVIGHLEDILERHGHWKLRHGKRDGE